MKVLHLFRDKHYSYSIYSIDKELRGLGIEQKSVLLDKREEAKEYLEEHVDSYDLLVINTGLTFPEIWDLKICVALAPQADNAFITPYVEQIKRSQGVIKNYAYTKRELHNQPYYRYSVKLLEDAGFENDLDRNPANVAHSMPELSEEDLDKIHVYAGFGAFRRMRPILDADSIDFDVQREIPIHFAGTTRYSGTPIEGHRKRAVEVCKECGGIGINDRSLVLPAYHKQLLKSRAVLSPWGWGENCHRDWEALAKGCILIKPDTSFCESWPDLTSANAPYIPCRLDFADVPDIVKLIEEHWEAYRAMRIRGYCLAQQAIDKVENAKKLAEIYKKIMAKYL